MKLSFLILAHKNPQQLQWLVDHLLNSGCKVYVHLDKKSESAFREFVQHNKGRDHLYLYCTYKVYWGSFNQIEATFMLLREALKHPFDFVSLISGQDLPIKPMDELKRFLALHMNSSFLEFHKLPDPSNMEGEGGLERVKYHWITDFGPKTAFFFNKLNVVLHFFQRVSGLTRSWPETLYAGPNWFTITKEAAHYAVEYCKTNPPFYTKFRNTRLADEIVLQTILLNNPGLDIKNQSLRLVDWKTGPEYPRIFRMVDLEKLRRSDVFFARKFDENVDIGIIKTLYSIV